MFFSDNFASASFTAPSQLPMVSIPTLLNFEYSISASGTSVRAVSHLTSKSIDNLLVGLGIFGVGTVLGVPRTAGEVSAFRMFARQRVR